MSTAIKRWVLVVILVLTVLTGCGTTGLIYTNTVAPYSKQFNDTPVGSKRCVLEDHIRVRMPFSGMNAEWTTEYILKEARKAGINNIYYIDLNTVSFVLGIYTLKRLYIYSDDFHSVAAPVFI